MEGYALLQAVNFHWIGEDWHKESVRVALSDLISTAVTGVIPPHWGSRSTDEGYPFRFRCGYP